MGDNDFIRIAKRGKEDEVIEARIQVLSLIDELNAANKLPNGKWDSAQSRIEFYNLSTSLMYLDKAIKKFDEVRKDAARRKERQRDKNKIELMKAQQGAINHLVGVAYKTALNSAKSQKYRGDVEIHTLEHFNTGDVASEQLKEQLLAVGGDANLIRDQQREEFKQQGDELFNSLAGSTEFDPLSLIFTPETLQKQKELDQIEAEAKVKPVIDFDDTSNE